MNSTKTRLAASMVVLGALVAVSSSAVAAPTDATLTGGALTSTAPLVGNFATVALDGTAKTTTAAVGTFSVSDLTGTGAGWKVTAQGTRFTAPVGTLNAGKQLAANSLVLSAPTATANGTTSTGPVVAAPAPIDSGTAVSIASAAAGTGMGTYDFTATTMTLSVPADAYAATYRSDVTITVASTP